jgi:uncharacterized membrane protein YeiH
MPTKIVPAIQHWCKGRALILCPGMFYLLEHFAISVSAITGALAARGKRVDLFGVIVLAVVTAFGGGTVRDLLLGDLPVLWVRDPAYLYNAAITGVVTFFLVRYRELTGSGLLVADAFSLALYSIVGVKKALLFNPDPVVAAGMGVVTGVAGGMIRDVLLGEIPMVFRREINFYATASLCGSVIFLALHAWFLNPVLNTVIAVLITLVLRLASIRWKLSLPDFEEGRPAGKRNSENRISKTE